HPHPYPLPLQAPPPRAIYSLSLHDALPAAVAVWSDDELPRTPVTRRESSAGQRNTPEPEAAPGSKFSIIQASAVPSSTTHSNVSPPPRSMGMQYAFSNGWVPTRVALPPVAGTSKMSFDPSSCTYTDRPSADQPRGWDSPLCTRKCEEPFE